MKAVFSPGPSYFDPEVREFAGWWHIQELYRMALEELGFEVFIPDVISELIDKRTTVSKILSWDIVAASQIPNDIDLFMGPPGYSLAQIMKVKSCNGSTSKSKVLVWVWNNADWWRDHQLIEETKRFNVPYDTSPTWRWINKTALQLSDCILSCSPFVSTTHRQVTGVDKSKVKEAFWGVDSSKFHPDELMKEVRRKVGEPYRILFVGSDPIRKGLSYLIEALSKVNIPHELYVVGCAPFGEGSVPNNWLQFGMVPQNDMPGIYQKCDILVCPTLEDGIALCVQEAMASGVVPIASPDAAEVFTDGISGYRVGFRAVNDLAQKIQILGEHPDKRDVMSKAAREQALSQTWNKTKESVKFIVKELVNGKQV